MSTWREGERGFVSVEFVRYATCGSIVNLIVRVPGHGPIALDSNADLVRTIPTPPVDPAKVKVGDMIHSRGIVIDVDSKKNLGLEFKVRHDGDGDDECTWLTREAIVHHEPAKHPTTPAEFYMLSPERRDELLAAWMAKGGA